MRKQKTWVFGLATLAAAIPVSGATSQNNIEKL
jgi:hypothetical protein